MNKKEPIKDVKPFYTSDINDLLDRLIRASRGFGPDVYNIRDKLLDEYARAEGRIASYIQRFGVY